MTEHQHDNCGSDCQDHSDQLSKKGKDGKTFVKVMKKFHLKEYKGITRVVLKTQKGFIMYIDNPAVVVSDKSDDSFVVFGELRYGEIESMIKGNKQANATNKPQEIKEESEEEDDEGVELDKGDLKEEDINELINYSQCSRNKAIRVLKKANGDLVEALSKLT